MGGHDPRRDLLGAGVSGLTGGAGLGGVIRADRPGAYFHPADT
ncbi:MAG TPA: hypothetical protein VEF72_26635 [Mycobacterium sp.]|nr:hypothetical protein [Mycobacterium sp.]